MVYLMNKNEKARAKAGRAWLHQISGKFKTGTHDPRPKRTRTRQADKDKAIKDQL